MECEQLAAAFDRHWPSGRSGALDRLATFDSGSKLLPTPYASRGSVAALLRCNPSRVLTF